MGFFSLAGTGPTTRVTRAMGLVISSCTVTCHLNSTPSSSSSNMFGDLKTAAGVNALDAFLADNSYIEGYVPSQADTAVFEALKGAPGSDTPHAQRWYNHIKSFAAGMKQFAKASSAYVAAGGAAPAPAEEEEDDDCDLFGSDEDEEDSEEKQKIVAAQSPRPPSCST